MLDDAIVKPSVQSKQPELLFTVLLQCYVVNLEKNYIKTTLVRHSLMSVSSKDLYSQNLTAVVLNEFETLSDGSGFRLPLYVSFDE